MGAQKVFEFGGVSVFGRIVRCVAENIIVEVFVIRQNERFSSHFVEVSRHACPSVREAVIEVIHQNPSIIA